MVYGTKIKNPPCTFTGRVFMRRPLITRTGLAANILVVLWARICTLHAGSLGPDRVSYQQPLGPYTQTLLPNRAPTYSATTERSFIAAPPRPY